MNEEKNDKKISVTVIKYCIELASISWVIANNLVKLDCNKETRPTEIFQFLNILSWYVVAAKVQEVHHCSIKKSSSLGGNRPE